MHIRCSYFELCEVITDNTALNTHMLITHLTIWLLVKTVCAFAL